MFCHCSKVTFLLISSEMGSVVRAEPLAVSSAQHHELNLDEQDAEKGSGGVLGSV